MLRSEVDSRESYYWHGGSGPELKANVRISLFCGHKRVCEFVE